MPTNREALLCRYHYDPLDRLVASSLSKQASTQRFYLKSRLATEIQDQVQHSIFQHEDQLLAQQQRLGGIAETTLLTTDQQRSVLNALDATPPHSFAYTPYGHRSPDGGLLSLLGFNGERPDPVTRHYLLGNGYRAFNPVLMRFNSPDSWSPFGKGGLNSYAYCVGDPVNRVDPMGHAGFMGMLKYVGKKLGLRESSRVTSANRVYEAARQTPVSAQISQANTVPDGPPPPYSPSTQSSMNSSRAAPLQTFEPPPPYSRSETHLVELPEYSPNNRVTPLGQQSTSTPNLEPPPPYFRQPPRQLSVAQEATLTGLVAHRQRITDTFRNANMLLSGSHLDTVNALTLEIRYIRGLGRNHPSSARMSP